MRLGHVTIWQRLTAAGLLAALAIAPVTLDAAQARVAKKDQGEAPATGKSATKDQPSRVGKNQSRPRGAGSWNRPNYAAIVIDDKTGQVLHEANADAPRHPASVTKIMTLYLLFEQLEAGHLKLDTPLNVSAYAASRPPTKLGLKPGQTLKVEDALKGLVTRSANDAASVIAEALGGSEEEFARLMTRKAIALGMSSTIYVNASGLPADLQITTARDQALLGRAIQHRFPDYFGYFGMPSFTYRGKEIRNHNALLGHVKGVDGIKTGYTRASGYNLVCSVKRDDKEIVAVVLGGKSGGVRDARMRELIEEYLPSANAERTAPATVERGPDGAPVTAAVAPELPGPALASDNSVDPMLLTDLVPGKATLRTDVADYEREDAPPGSKEDQERKAKRAAEAEKYAAKPGVKNGAKNGAKDGAKNGAKDGKPATAAKDHPTRAKRPAGTTATAPTTAPAAALAQRHAGPAAFQGRD